jgi:hypothetical protein
MIYAGFRPAATQVSFSRTFTTAEPASLFNPDARAIR